MKYFVTGRNGFIGGHVLKYLSGKKIVDRMVTGCTVVHLAAYGNHYFQTEPEKIIKANITDLKRMIDRAIALKVEKFYNISTSSVSLSVQTMYSASKLFGETMICWLLDKRFVNIRPYSVYGEGEASHRFIPTVIRNLKSGDKMELDPTSEHDWIFVTDFVNALFDGHKQIGTGKSYTNLQIVEFLEEISGKKLNYSVKKLRDYDTHDWVCKKGISHRDIRDGLKQTYDYYNSLP